MLAKPGKDDYAMPKAYRPISLTPFFFKLLERVCAWNICETALRKNPLHKRQHAYRVGRSTESAISQVLNEIEKGMNEKSYTLSTFIDISAAFDKLDPYKATNALRKGGVDAGITEWYLDYLTERYAHIEIKEVKSIRKITVGCPQGGVLSTILWNISFDSMLRLFKNSGVICIGYADDGSLIINGHHLHDMYKDMNIALQKCKEWAVEFGLDLSPSKTNYMLFTRKKAKTYKKQIPKEGIRIGSEEIERVTSVKYLGLTIEHTLSWSEHINNKCDQARKTIFRLRNFIGKTWGPSPEMVHYAYTSCIRPILSYACFAFAHKLSTHIQTG